MPDRFQDPASAWENACNSACQAVIKADFERQGDKAVASAEDLLALARSLKGVNRSEERCPHCREMELRVLHLSSALRDCELALKIVIEHAMQARKRATATLDRDGVPIASISEEER